MWCILVDLGSNDDAQKIGRSKRGKRKKRGRRMSRAKWRRSCGEQRVVVEAPVETDGGMDGWANVKGS